MKVSLIIALVSFLIVSSLQLGRSFSYQNDCSDKKFEHAYEYQNGKCYTLTVNGKITGSRKTSCNKTHVFYFDCGSSLNCTRCGEYKSPLGCQGNRKEFENQFFEIK
jgi:hypothetical protein